MTETGYIYIYLFIGSEQKTYICGGSMMLQAPRGGFSHVGETQIS